VNKHEKARMKIINFILAFSCLFTAKKSSKKKSEKENKPKENEGKKR